MPRSSGRVAVQKPEQIHLVKTVSTIDFTGALSIGAHEDAVIPGLLANNINIRGINGQSVQNLKYRLWVWGDSGMHSPNIDQCSYITDIIIDFSDTIYVGKIAPTDQFSLDVDSLERSITTKNKSLYLSLQNLSPIAKIAGPLGAVQFDIKYALRM